MRNLTLKHLKAIQAITAQGKIINAAKALGLTPPAVTIQLKQLEEDVGLALFDRTQDGMRPTAAGLAIIDAAQVPLLYAADSIDITRAFIAEFNSKNPVTAATTTTPPQ